MQTRAAYAPNASSCTDMCRGALSSSGGQAHKPHLHARLAVAAALGLTLCACSPTDMADKVGRRAAASVVTPVVAANMPSGPAQMATNCIVQNATAAEVQALARDIGVVAGTSTRATIRAIAVRPEAQACFAASGVPPVL